MKHRSYVPAGSPGAMEVEPDSVPPVPPDLDLDLDLDIDFDQLPEIEIPDEGTSIPAPGPVPVPLEKAPFVVRPRPQDTAERPFPWFPVIAGGVTMLLVALVSAPLILARINSMASEVSALSGRIDASEAENKDMNGMLKRSSMDLVAKHLADTDRRIERLRGSLDEIRRGRGEVAAVPERVAEKPQPPLAERKVLPPPPKPEQNHQPETLPLPLPGPVVGASKKEQPTKVVPVSSVREEKPREVQPKGRIPLPTQLYDEGE